ncbi:FbpB family small basic protein [Lentibacillus halodurans]|uniref:FbpB family small basic protein n=1 Tax=Lentibacillus halodurans TaxID=237679 RepID=UPI001113E590|nr:FbpB family small basic protein [Lentibacillus halodurans]
MVILFLKLVVYSKIFRNNRKKELITISLKKRLSFDELVQENRKQILQDESLLERIEQNLETKMHQSLDKKRAE